MISRSLALTQLALSILVACGGAVTSTPNDAAPQDPKGVPEEANGSSGTAPDGVRKPEESNVCTAAVATTTCELPLDVTSADEAIAFIEAITMANDPTVGASSGMAWKPTRDIRFATTTEITGARLRERKTACADVADSGSPFQVRCFDWTLAPEKPFHTTQSPYNGRKLGTTYPAGIECVEPGTEGRDGCERIRIAAGTIVRFQRVHEPFPFGASRKHYVRVVRACTTPCEANELRCGASTTCFTEGQHFCLLCEGLGENVCVCRDGCKTKPNGTDCFYDTSDDTGNMGTCSAGSCEPKK